MNLTRFFSFLKRPLLITAALVTISISSCNDDDDGPSVYNGTTLDLITDQQYKQSSTVTADVALDSLVKYISVYPELTDMLSGSTEYTFFAPSNQAFINLLATAGFPQNIKLISPDLIKNVLLYHFVAGKQMKSALTPGTTLTSAYTDPLSPGAAQTITVNQNGTLKAAPNATNVDIDIVKADIQSKNGVVHILESVMIPPSTGAVLVPILGTVAGTVLLGKDFTNLAKIVMAADAGFTENPAALSFKVSTWLAMPVSTSSVTTANQKGITFFAPPNAVLTTPILTEATANAIIASPDKGRSFLLNHLVISGNYTVSDPPSPNPSGITKLTNGTQLTPVSGAAKKITISVSTPSAQNPNGVAISNNQTLPPPANTFVPIVSKDVAHSNGTIQVIAGALQ